MSTPVKPSQLILDALTALGIAEGLEEVRVDMGQFRNLLRHGQGELHCFACLGGSYRLHKSGMLKEGVVGAMLSEDALPITDEEHALDQFRRGNCALGFQLLGREHRRGEPYNRAVPHYETNPKGFKLTLKQLARDLARDGL